MCKFELPQAKGSLTFRIVNVVYELPQRLSYDLRFYGIRKTLGYYEILINWAGTQASV